MKIITLIQAGRYNYHNADDIDIRCKEDMVIVRGGVVVGYELTQSQIRRIKKHYCGRAECECGSRPDGWEEIDYNRATINL